MLEPRQRGLFVTGTEAGVGKSLVAGSLAGALRRRGLVVALSKPVDTRCPRRPMAPGQTSTVMAGMPGEVDTETLAAAQRLAAVAGPPPAALLGATPSETLLPRDAPYLLHLAGLQDANLETITPFRFAADVAPRLAARIAGHPLTLDALSAAVAAAATGAEIVIVEDAGGLFAPLTEDALTVDLLQALGFPALLVGRSSPSALNHCLLCLDALDRRALPCAGVVLSRHSEPRRSDEVATPQLIDEVAGDVIRGVLPFYSDAQLEDTEFLAERFRVHVDIDRLLST